MQLPDGTAAEITGLINDGDVISLEVLITWPDKTQGRAQITASQPIQITASPLGLKLAAK